LEDHKFKQHDITFKPNMLMTQRHTLYFFYMYQQLQVSVIV
jgi:hypothetical protein